MKLASFGRLIKVNKVFASIVQNLDTSKSVEAAARW